MYRQIVLFCLTVFTLPCMLRAQVHLQLEDWASGFTRPVDIAHCGDSRIFVVEQAGLIWVLDSLGNKLDTFLYIAPRIDAASNERGLLGLAFHPDYAQNGYFFVYYTRSSDAATQVSRFSVRSDNPNRADPDSELPILGQSQPYSNHNGGCMKFGPDGYLYIGLGDGGSGGDPQGNGQKTTTFLGKMLRIDVDSSSINAPYAIPPDNPFVGQANYAPEIWALGMRNPWRYSFDRLTGDIWIGDVGQNDREEVDFQPAGTGGRNYGWRCYEGDLSYNSSGCQAQNTYITPVFTYPNPDQGCSITGGFIYRGSKYPDLYGLYLNTDYCSGRVWATRRINDSTFTSVEVANFGNKKFSTFGEDKDGELYIALLSAGKIQKITELCSAFQLDLLHINSPVCDSTFSGLLEVAPVNGTGDITYSWSNGQTTAADVYLEPGNYTVTATDDNGCTRTASYTIASGSVPPPSLAVSDSILCANEGLTLTANNFPAGSVLTWYRNNTPLQTDTATETPFNFFVPAPAVSGQYTVQLQDSLCPVFSNNIQVLVEPAITPEIYQSGDTLYSVLPCNDCQWLQDNQPVPGGIQAFFVPDATGVYSLDYTSANGCIYHSNTIQVTISETAMPANVKQFSLKPNPTDGMLTLEMHLEKQEHFSLTLLDSNQRQLFYQTRQQDHIVLPIDLRAAPAGTYFLVIKTESGSFSRKIVKR